MEIIKIAICDDAEFWCDFIQDTIEDCNDMSFAGKAANAKACVSMVQQVKPDVLLLDIQMETKTAGVDIITDVLAVCPDIKIIMTTGYDYDEYVFAAFANGAVDYLTKEMPAEVIINTIRAVYFNQSTLRPEIAGKLAKGAKNISENKRSLLMAVDSLVKLTTAEYELLKAVYCGENYNDIARERFVEPQSVRMMASRILKKFDADSMEQLVEELRALKIFELFREI